MSSPNPSSTESSATEQIPEWQPPRRKNGQGGTSPQVEKALVDVRRKIYPRSVTGVFARWRVWLVLATQLVFYGLPWIEWHGRQAVLFDLAARKFYLFGMILWPQDVIYLTILLLLSAFSLFLFTAMAGRLFCGYACPQTVYTEIFMWVERKVEGDRLARIRLDEQPWTLKKLRIKTLKHFLWVLIAFWTGYTFIGYFAPIRDLGGDLLALSLGPWQWFWLVFYAFATWGNAGFMREAVCKYMCPYARFQSVMVDNDTFVVTYDHVRGDPRGGRSRKIDHKSAGMGDCVDCSLCVQVCPTGIDIRDGLQYMCIGCGACVDACDQVMDKMSYDRGLIRYTSGRAITERLSQAQVRKRMLRPRVVSYILILAVIFGAFLYSLSTRVPMRMDIMRDRGALGREVPGGFYENVYQLQFINTSETSMQVSLSAIGLPNLTLQTAEGHSDELRLDPAANRLVAVVAKLPVQDTTPGLYNIVIKAVSHHDDGQETVVTESTSFYVPQ